MYEENWAALEVFATLVTQWRTGMSGPTGLDYNVLPGVMDLLGVPQGERCERFDELRVMERAALSEMARNRKK